MIKYCIPFLFVIAPSVYAQSANLNNTSTVVRACTISTVQHMSFPSLDVNSPGLTLTANGTVQIMCTPGNYSIYILGGNNNTVSYTRSDRNHYFSCNRSMKNGNSTLPYSILIGDGQYAGYPNTGDTLSIGYYDLRDYPLATEYYDRGMSRACDDPTVVYGYANFVPNNKAPQNIIIKGRITAAKNIKPGVYMDTITLAVTF